MPGSDVMEEGGREGGKGAPADESWGHFYQATEDTHFTQLPALDTPTSTLCVCVCNSAGLAGAHRLHLGL